MTTVYDKGAAAFKAGLPIDANPHCRHSDPLAYSAWRSGWDFARYMRIIGA